MPTAREGQAMHEWPTVADLSIGCASALEACDDGSLGDVQEMSATLAPTIAAFVTAYRAAYGDATHAEPACRLLMLRSERLASFGHSVANEGQRRHTLRNVVQETRWVVSRMEP